MEAQTKDLKYGVFLYFIAVLFAIIGLMFIRIFFIFGIILSILIFLLAIIFFIGALIKLWESFSLYETKNNIISIGKFGLILSIIPIISIVGWILVGISFYEIGIIENNDMLKFGGILTAIPIINIFGLLIIFFSL